MSGRSRHATQDRLCWLRAGRKQHTRHNRHVNRKEPSGCLFWVSRFGRTFSSLFLQFGTTFGQELFGAVSPKPLQLKTNLHDKILCATSQIVRKCLMPHTQHQTDQTVRLSPKQTQTPSWQTRQNPDRFCPAALMLFWQSSWARLVTAASSASDSISLKSWQCQKDPTHGPARAQEQRKHSDNRAVPARSRRAVITSCSKPSFRDAAMHVPASQ